MLENFVSKIKLLNLLKKKTWKINKVIQVQV